MNEAHWSGPAFETIAGLVTAETGLTVSPNRRGWAEDRIRRAMKRMGIHDPTEYLRRLGETDGLDDLVNDLAIGETYFFRDRGQFEFIRHEALADLRRHLGLGHRVRAWSAGCASGEEAYSLAILLEQEGLGVESEVVGTDIARLALAKATKGHYGAWSFRGDPMVPMDPYFHRLQAGFAVRDRLRERVVWRHLNLVSGSYPSEANGTAALDLILCRNVLIYFEPQIVCAVQTRLFAALAPGGWLVLGASDPPMPPIDACEKVVTEAGIFYRRGGRTISTCAIAVKPAESAAAPHGRGSPPIGQPNPDAPVSDRATPSAFALGDAAVPRQQEGAGLSSSAEKPGAEPDAWAALVGELANRGDAIAAEHTALEGIGRYPLVPELHHLRALLLLGLGRLDEAAEAARRLLYLDRKLAFGHLTLAVILQRMGKADEAARAFRNAESLLAAQRPDSVVPLAEGRCAGLLAETVRGQLSILCGSGEPTV